MVDTVRQYGAMSSPGSITLASDLSIAVLIQSLEQAEVSTMRRNEGSFRDDPARLPITMISVSLRPEHTSSKYNTPVQHSNSALWHSGSSGSARWECVGTSWLMRSKISLAFLMVASSTEGSGI